MSLAVLSRVRPCLQKETFGSNGKIQSLVCFELLGVKMAPGVLRKCSQRVVLPSLGVDCGSQFYLLCPAMGYGILVNCKEKFSG